MQQYLDILDRILYKGTPTIDRTGTGTLKVFGERMCFNLQDGFPLLTTKFVSFKLVAGELLWFIQGGRRHRQLNINDLKKITPDNNIWNEWARDNGDLGPVYGVQWRSWPRYNNLSHTDDMAWIDEPIDQLQDVIDSIMNNPNSRRHIVSAWNISELDDMQLPPCHILFQFFVADGALSCQVYQRSCDMFLGVPFNIASYALLTHMVAKTCCLNVDKLIWVGGDCHIYQNHVDQCVIQLGRPPRPLPNLGVSAQMSIDDYRMKDIEIYNYNPHSHIPAPISV